MRLQLLTSYINRPINMINLLLIPIRYLIFAILSLSFSSYAADKITLNFTGNIKLATCDVSGPTNIDIDLNKMSVDLFNTPQSGSDWKPFTIKLINCPLVINQIKVTFTGTADNADINSLYKNSGSAQNIAIQLENEDGSVKLGNNKFLLIDSLNRPDAEFTLKTRAFSQNGSATPGSVSANVTATFIYL